MQKTTKFKIVLFGLAITLIFAKPAYAYLDPGTGSYIFQILIAGALGATIFVKDITKKVKKVFELIFSKKTSTKSGKNGGE